MPVVRQSRVNLDRAVGLPVGPDDEVEPESLANIVMLIAGPDSGATRAMYRKALDKATEPWRHVFLVTDVTVLTDAERESWIAAPNDYCVVKVHGHVVAAKGRIEDLQFASGNPSGSRIRDAFVAGEQA